MSVRMYSNPLPLSSHDLPRMLWKASGESREPLAKRGRRGWGAEATAAIRCTRRSDLTRE